MISRLILVVVDDEMPAIGNKGKVFCPFVEYDWDSGHVQVCVGVKSAALNPSYLVVIKRFNVIHASVDPVVLGGSRLAFSSKRRDKYLATATRGKHMDWRRHTNQ